MMFIIRVLRKIKEWWSLLFGTLSLEKPPRWIHLPCPSSTTTSTHTNNLSWQLPQPSVDLGRITFFRLFNSHIAFARFRFEYSLQSTIPSLLAAPLHFWIKRNRQHDNTTTTAVLLKSSSIFLDSRSTSSSTPLTLMIPSRRKTLDVAQQYSTSRGSTQSHRNHEHLPNRTVPCWHS